MSEPIAIYLRISQEDIGLKTDSKSESESISNQRNLLTDYVKTNFPGREIIEFCDDGWSGKNFQRPAVSDMLAQVKAGIIKCIVVKDLSRFGRDYIEVGNYISRVFPFLGVRFIALGDGYDSIRPQDVDSINTSFKTLIYDLYSRELSRKVRAAKRRKAEQGDWVCGFTPFGYIKDPQNINHLIADPESAKTVRRIFLMAVSGMGSIEITRTLNAENVLTPMMHKLNIGTNQPFMTCINEDNFWMQSAVARILRDERYTGKNIYGKRTRDIIGNSHTIQTSRDSWVVVGESHDAIITQEEYAKAQNALRKYHELHCTPKSNHPLRGKLVCGVCGHIMCRSNGKEAHYYCKTPKQTEAYPCHDNILPEADMIDIVLVAIRNLARLAVELEKILATKQDSVQLDRKELFKSLQSLQQQKAQLGDRLKTLYEAFVDRTISRDEYIGQKQTLSLQLEEHDRQIVALEKKVNCLDAPDNNTAIEAVKHYTAVDVLSDELSAQLLERAKVYPNGELEIQLNFQNELEALAQAIK